MSATCRARSHRRFRVTPVPMVRLGASLARERRWQRLLALWISVYLALCPNLSVGAGRDILWEIVSQCVDTAAQDYCAHCGWPQAYSSCAPSNDCRNTTEVWARTSNFVALRDIKMCGCSGGFVHGLALPRQAISGVE